MKYQVLLNLVFVSSALAADNWSTYPSVAKSASINGFADKIYASLPSCAQNCVRKSTGGTPCPYWDTGCLCVMESWSGDVAECIASNCKGNDVDVATSLADGICSSAGVWEPYWIIPSSASAALQSAASQAASTTSEIPTTSSSPAAPSSSAAPVSTASDQSNSVSTTSSSVQAESSQASVTNGPSMSASQTSTSFGSSSPGTTSAASVSQFSNAANKKVGFGVGILALPALALM